MSAIWGRIDFNSNTCTMETMASEYKRKCKLDRIREIHYENTLFGSGLQIINDEDEYEEMPYVLDGGDAVITADSILDNRKELINELGCKEDMIPDGKLICLAYKKWHYDLVNHLEGIFAIAIFNSKDNELFLAVDHSASRCLYYYREAGSCTFSTLLSPIVQTNKEIKRNEEYLKEFLALPGLVNTVSATETPWENVYHFEPGTYVIIDTKTSFKEGIKCVRYYSPSRVYETKDISKLKDLFIQTYSDVAASCIRTNGKVGITLSSGFDSSSVASIAAPLLKKKGKDLNSYTYVPYYKEEAKKRYPKIAITDETELVEEIAKMYPNIKTHYEDNDGKSFLDYVDEIVDVLELPIKAFVNMPLLMSIYKRGKEDGNKIFLNGQYGNFTVSFGDIGTVLNQLFIDHRYLTFLKYYNNYCKNAGKSRKKNILPLLKQEIKGKQKVDVNIEYIKKEANVFVCKDVIDSFDFYSKGEISRLYESALSQMTRDAYLIELYNKSMLSYIGEAETKLGLYAGIVIRDPTRNRKILDYCYSFPFEFFSYNGEPRYLIRGFLADRLPRSILYPYVKRGIQGADWLDRIEASKETVFAELDEMFEQCIGDKYFDIKKIRRFLTERKSFDVENSDEYLQFFITFVFVKTLNNRR